MAVSYKTLGLVNTKEMFADAMKNHYAVPAYNFNNMDLGGAVREAPRIRRQLAFFSVALFLFLTGLVVAAATLARHFGAAAPAA